MSVEYNPRIITDEMLLYLDASNQKSYYSTASFSELITNGTFDSNVSGWSTYNSTNTWSSGKMQIYRSGGAERTSYQSFTTVPGVTYFVTAEVNSSGSRGDLYIIDKTELVGGEVLLFVPGTYGQTVTSSGFFTAQSTTSTIQFGIDNLFTSIVVDNVSVLATWNDLSGNNNSGTLINGPIYNSANNGSLVFDGTNDYISFPFDTKLLPTSGLTISTWFKTSVADRWLLHKTSSSGVNGYVLSGNSSSKIEFVVSNKRITTPDNITTGSWLNIVGTWTPSTSMILYQNGIPVVTDTISIPSSIVTTTSNIQIGNRPGGGDYWSGNIAQVLIYGRALSSTEIKQNYNALRYRFGL